MSKELPPGASYLAREIHRRMRLLGMSQKSLALASRNNETYVRDIFKGRSLNPKSEQFARLASVLGCSVADLLGPDPSIPGSQPQIGDLIQDAEEAAILALWRVLKPRGRRRLLKSMKDAAPLAPIERQANDT